MVKISHLISNVLKKKDNYNQRNEVKHILSIHLFDIIQFICDRIGNSPILSTRVI
jgi:hypothetical protein